MASTNLQKYLDFKPYKPKKGEDKVIHFSELVKLKTKQIHQSNPKIILKKGYAIIRDNKYRIMKNSALAKNNDHLKIEMADGYVDVYRKKKKT